jgi:hypothetical protein
MVETAKKQIINRPLIRWIWWVTFVASVLLTLASIPGYGLMLSGLEPSSEFATVQQAATWLGMLLSVGSAILCLLLALLVFSKRPGEPMAMFLSFFLLMYGFILVGPLERFLGYWFPQPNELAHLLPPILETALIFTLLPALALIFPNGHFEPHWTRGLLVAEALLVVGVFLTFDSDDWLKMTAHAWVGITIMGAPVLLALGVQFYRYRWIYGLVERQQTKWVLIGLVSMLILAGIGSSVYAYKLDLPPGTPQPWWAPLTGAGWWLSLALLPVSLTIAILRYRLFDIDVIIRRTLVYGALTATLALVYFGSVILLQGLFQTLTGQSQSQVVTVISTLAIAALFSPLRRRIQNDIDRRFYRKKYDAEQALEAFALMVRQEVDLDEISSSLLAVVQETMQPEQVSLWLNKKPSKGLRGD